MNAILPKRPTASGMKLAHPGLALVILFAFFAFFLIITPILSGLIAHFCQKPVVVVRLSMIIQDILVFILPAIATALLATRLPARLLAIDRMPSLKVAFIAVAVLLSSMPIMNIIVEWNQSVKFPESLSELELTFRNLEETAQGVVDSLMAGASVGSLIVSILIIGVLAGFSEELFFRGAMQRIFMSGTMNGHMAIWTVAVIFSLFHFQFFGFVPRVLLGGYFGYLLWWSRSVWLPVLLHVVNNSLVVFFTWRTVNYPEASINPDKIGTDLTLWENWLMAGISVVVTSFLIVLLKKECRRM